MQMTGIWLQGVYLTAVKNYRALFFSYLTGVFTSVALCFLVLWTGLLPPVDGSLLAMNIGSAVILTLFLAHILRYFGYTKKGLSFRFLPYFEMHPKLFFIGLFYTAALYLPNFIIWLGPDGLLIDGTYRCAPTYDVATFFAFLSIMPVMVMFTVSAELNFYERYAVYYLHYKARQFPRHRGRAHRSPAYTVVRAAQYRGVPARLYRDFPRSWQLFSAVRRALV